MMTNPFSEEERQNLLILVGLIIPANDEYGVPGADDPIIFAKILKSASDHHSELTGILAALDVEDLASEHLGHAAQTVRQSDPSGVALLEKLTVENYYSDDRVMRSLDMETRAPFPKGFDLEQGDMTLLDPVRERPVFYRKTT
jgi:hypothetical protein